VVWSADFKGQFRLGNKGAYCYPLTISDNYSRFLLACEGLKKPTLKASIKCFKQVFGEYGLPDAIRTDNGQPFAGLGLGGLTQLSIWWIKLGITPERIKPGCPQQNGRHERMHRTLKEATALIPEKTFKEQQQRFNQFIEEYNYERSHQGLNGQRPAEVYIKSKRALPITERLEVYYPDYFLVRKIRVNGEIKWEGKKYYVSELLAGEPVGLEQIDDERAILYFSRVKLGILDTKKDRIIRL
jgi:putative transposase